MKNNPPSAAVKLYRGVNPSSAVKGVIHSTVEPIADEVDAPSRGTYATHCRTLCGRTIPLLPMSFSTGYTEDRDCVNCARVADRIGAGQ